MGKTIRVELTEAEKKIVKHLKKGSSNSEFLKKALWYYINNAPPEPQKKKSFSEPSILLEENKMEKTQNDSNLDPYIRHLNDEIFYLREELSRIQEQNYQILQQMQEESRQLHEQYTHLFTYLEHLITQQQKETATNIIIQPIEPEPQPPIQKPVDTPVNQPSEKPDETIMPEQATQQQACTKSSQKQGLFKKMFFHPNIR